MRHRIKTGIVILTLFLLPLKVSATEIILDSEIETITETESETEAETEIKTETETETEVEIGAETETETEVETGTEAETETEVEIGTETETELETEVETSTETETETKVEIGAETESEIEVETSTETETESETEVIKAVELDLGEYSEKMTIGEKQLLSVTILPLDATETTITYSSANQEIASVNGMGRITALSLGKTSITVTCGEISQSFELEVVEKEDETIYVRDIEIGNHEEEVEVGKTITISGTVLPSDATNSTITYTSSDASIATVTSTGEVKGIAVGDVIIRLSAGGITKETSVKVKVATAGITLNEDYLILKPEETYQLSAKVTPAEAVQKVTYKSTNKSVAVVSSNGFVTAKDVGTATIIVSNGDSIAAVSVIVNEAINYTKQEEIEETSTEKKVIYGDIVLASKQRIVSSQMLKQIYETKQILQIIGEGYVIEIDGNDIVNYNNEFYTDIFLQKEDDKWNFVLNQGEELCGKITLRLEEPKGKYLYLYNVSKETYQQIEFDDLEKIELTTAGEYQIRNTKLKSDMQIVLYVMIGGVGILLCGLGGYIFVKRKYWFW